MVGARQPTKEMRYARRKNPTPKRNQPPTRGGIMTAVDAAIDTAAIARLADRVEQQRVANEAAKKAADYLKKLTSRRNFCWFVSGLCFAAVGLVSFEIWTGKSSVSIGVIIWLSLGVALFAILANSVQAAIHQRHSADLAAELRAEIRDHAPADAIELARIATMVQQVAATQVKLSDRLASVEALNDRLDKLAELIPLAIGEAARTAVGAERAAMVGMVEQVARKAYAAAVQDLRSAFAAEREAAAREMEETIKRVFAQGYVAGARERHNGDGGKVVQLPFAQA